MKKTLSIMAIAILMLTLGMGAVNATTDFKVALTADSTRVEQGGTVVITVSLKDFTANETGINSLIATLDYDKTVFETVKQADFAAQNGWSAIVYNENEGKLTTDNASFMTENHEAFKVTLKVKANATIGNTTVTLKEINGSDADTDVYPAEQKITLTVRAASGNTPAPSNNTPTNNATPTKPNNNATMPSTGVVDYILPTIAVVAVIGIFAYVRYNRIDK